MKKIIIYFVIMSPFFFTACEKNRSNGFCYCKYVTGTNTISNLSTLSRPEQIERCDSMHTEANVVGGACELE